MTNRLADEASYFGAVADGAASRDDEVAELRQHVKLLRDALKCYAHISYGFYWSPITRREEPRMVARDALTATAPKEN